MAEDHFEAPELNDLHAESRASGTTEGGACLTGHEGNFRKKGKKNTCNYRYQAYEQAKSESQIKDRLQSYRQSTKKGDILTSVYKTEAGGWAPAYYSASLPAPGDGDWDVEGPTKPVYRKTLKDQTLKIPTGMNFTQDTWPYWNNAHHIIPKGLLKAMIGEQPDQVPNVMRKALLKAKYNVNHKKNMFFLPQDKEVATIIHLTRHIQLRHDDAPEVSEIFTDHPVYNRMVKVKLNDIIDGYKAACDDPSPDGHKIPNAEVDKSKLEDLSKTLMESILAWGETAAGASLDKVANATFSDL
jgi:hypothetical protein